jgi:D-alanine-D-alanine ligase-like ATP-grasp enzyme
VTKRSPNKKTISPESVIQTITLPVITKPRIGSRGRHTNTYLKDILDIKRGFKIAQKLCRFVMVEEHLEGSVYRGTLVNNTLVGVLEGQPPRVTGDGIHTIKELVEFKNTHKNEKIASVEIDTKLEKFIERKRLRVDSIPKKDAVIDLSEKIGLSYGGYSEELFDKIHPKIKIYLEEAAKVLDAGVIGFDFIIPDPTKDPDTQRWGIIECNSLPFINLHHNPLVGKPIRVAEKVSREASQK